MVFTGTQSRSIQVAIEGDASSLRNAVGNAQTGLMNLRNAVRLAGGALAAFSAGAIAKSIRSASNLETKLSEVTTLMGEGQDAAEKYGDTVSRLSTEFGLQGGQVEATEALYQTLSAGIADAGDETEFLETSMRAATAGLTDTGTAVDALSTVVNAYNLRASEATRVSDVLFTTVREGKTRFQELAGTIGRVVPTASEMGVQIEELGAAIATLTAQGQSTDQAVTAVNRTLTSLLKPTSEAAEVIQRMGFESGRALVEQEGLAGALEALQRHAENSSDELTDVFANVRALRAVLPLANEASQDFNDNLEEMEGSAGAANEAFEEMADTTEFRFRQSLNELRATMTRTGESFMPTVSDMADGINDLLESFNDLNQASDGVAGQLTMLGGVAAGTGLVFGSTAGIIAGAAAAAFMAWSQNMLGMRDATQRSVADIQDSLGRLTNSTGDEIGQQLDLWDRWGIRIADTVDMISTTFAIAVDGIVSGSEIIRSTIGQSIEQWKAIKEGDLERARELAREGGAERRGIAEDFVERTNERRGTLGIRSDLRSSAISEDDPSLLPRRGNRPLRGSRRSDPSSGVKPGDLVETFREEQERTRKQQQDLLEDIRDENRRTADATTATLGGGPCDLREHLLGPLERAPRPIETGGAGRARGGGGGGGTGSQSAAQERIERGAQSREPGSTGAMITSGSGTGFGSAEAVNVELTLDGKRVTEELDRAENLHHSGAKITQ